MESVEAPIEKHRIRIVHMTETTVKRVYQDADGQWFVHFDGSREAIGFGSEPHYNVGDRVKITFEKVS